MPSLPVSFSPSTGSDGQITNITSGLFGESWTYGYDDLKRLTSAANIDEPAYSRTYSYDTVGNILTKSDVDPGTYSYPLPGNPQPHAVTSAGGKNYSYDANGNMTQVTDGLGAVLRDLVWDGENRPTEIDGVTLHYGPDGSRWKKVDTTTGEVTLTLGEIEIQDAGTVNEVMVKYLPGSARRTGTTTLWHHKDHLGSIQAVTGASGAVALRRIHAPFGKRVHDSGAGFVEAKDFIGERLDGETGLLYLNARYYDPVLGRFISGDPSSPLEGGVGVNRYAYALNNPVSYSDPYGLKSAGEREVAEMEARSAAREAEEAAATANGEVQVAEAGAFVGPGLRALGVGGRGGVGAAVGEATGSTVVGRVVSALLGETPAEVVEWEEQRFEEMRERARNHVNSEASDEGESTKTPAADPAAGEQTSGTTEEKIKQLEKGINSTEQNIEEHKQKRDDYVKDPDKYDNKGFLDGATPERREKVIEGRVKGLNNEIEKFEKNVEKMKEEIDRLKGI